ncbi:Phage integrase family protein [Celeribacter neptunius]|uniref:Phage integrase family protein n=1 Tax=Celeribacter neptunius TaxID=588602 RepID=A0A1I3P1F1_9RHOB|nr:Phage integrase family protein [Celeribacter neptunius]
MKRGAEVKKASHSRVEKRLNAAWVQSAPPGRHADGGGLYLQVDSSGARRWYIRLVVRGKRRDLGLGSLKYVSLAQARAKALEMRAIARAGGNPRAAERRKEGHGITFRDMAIEVHSRKFKGGQHNGKHVAQWIRTLEIYAFPLIGDLSISEIHSDDVEQIIDPIWDSKPETARRVLQRVSTVFDHACGKGYRGASNPARGLRGLMREQRVTSEHFQALNYHDVTKLMYWLQENDAIGSYALRFAILTAARSAPVRLATWEQVSEDFTVWTIPGGNMKSREEFQIPTSIPVRNLLLDLRSRFGKRAGYIFPSPQNPAKPLSENTMRKLLQSQYPGATVHGMRASFRTWAAEAVNARHEVAETALAHTVSSKTVAAYLRTDYLNERHMLMEMWGMWVMGEWEWFDDRMDIETEINDRLFGGVLAQT